MAITGRGLLLALATSASLQAADLPIKAYQTGTERRLDNPLGAWMNAWSGLVGGEVRRPAKVNNIIRYESQSNDPENGDF